MDKEKTVIAKVQVFSEMVQNEVQQNSFKSNSGNQTKKINDSVENVVVSENIASTENLTFTEKESQVNDAVAVKEETMPVKAQEVPEIEVEKEPKNFEEAVDMIRKNCEAEEREKQEVAFTENQTFVANNEQDVSVEIQISPNADAKKAPERPKEWFERAGKKIKAEKRFYKQAWVGLCEGPEMIAVSWHWSLYRVKGWLW